MQECAHQHNSLPRAGSISISWQIKEIEYPTYVIILSLCNAAGRLIYGLATDQVYAPHAF